MSVHLKYSKNDFKKSRDMSYLHGSNIEKKEFYETEETIHKSISDIKKYFGIDRLNNIYDFCSGHSYTCFHAVSRNLTKYAISIDIRHPKSSYKISSYFSQFISRVIYKETDIFQTDFKIEPNSVVFSIHPCRNLAFRVAEIAIKNRVPVVIVPCCKSGNVKSWIDSFDNLIDYQRYSMKIAEFIATHGYDIKIKRINEIYTPKNIIIIGLPKSNI